MCMSVISPWSARPWHSPNIAVHHRGTREAKGSILERIPTYPPHRADSFSNNKGFCTFLARSTSVPRRKKWINVLLLIYWKHYHCLLPVCRNKRCVQGWSTPGGGGVRGGRSGWYLESSLAKVLAPYWSANSSPSLSPFSLTQAINLFHSHTPLWEGWSC